MKTFIFRCLFTFVICEVIFYFFTSSFYPDDSKRLSESLKSMNPKTALYSPHPFLQYTYNTQLKEGFRLKPRKKGDPYYFQGQLFSHKDPIPLKKKENEVRIFAIGGSTTAFGYPQLLENTLRQSSIAKNKFINVYNLGIPRHSSTHLLINLVTNIIHLSPDFIIVHAGWGDSFTRIYNSQFYQIDNSHAYRPFAIKPPADFYILSISRIYRWVRLSFFPGQDFSLKKLLQGTSKSQHQALVDTFVYYRNLKTMAQLGSANKYRLILATMPYATKVISETWLKRLTEANTVMKQVHTEYKTTALVDLDLLMTGKSEYDKEFTDVAHLTNRGKQAKADFIAQAIIEALKNSPRP